MKRFAAPIPLAAAIAIVCASVSIGAQGPVTAKKAPAKPYAAPKTPWGDPDISGIYTNKDENGIPFEKPSQFEGKNLDDVDDSEFAEIVRARNATAPTRAIGIGGADTGAGPIHWYEHYDAKNSRPWLVVDPADGKIPPTTPEAQKRAADRAARRAGRGPADSYEDRSLYDQCITRGLPAKSFPTLLRVISSTLQRCPPRQLARSGTSSSASTSRHRKQSARLSRSEIRSPTARRRR